MNKRLKKIFAIAGAATALTVGSVVTPAVTGVGAEKAEAYSTTIKSTLVCYGRYAYLEQWGYVDFTWAEEFWLGKKDYRYLISRTYQPQMNYKCQTVYLV